MFFFSIFCECKWPEQRWRSVSLGVIAFKSQQIVPTGSVQQFCLMLFQYIFVAHSKWFVLLIFYKGELPFEVRRCILHLCIVGKFLLQSSGFKVICVPFSTCLIENLLTLLKPMSALVSVMHLCLLKFCFQKQSKASLTRHRSWWWAG